MQQGFDGTLNKITFFWDMLVL